jgi:hypothetical protein
MAWTRGVAVGTGLLALSGCVYGYSTVGVARYSTETRPTDSYFCYDCHGYRYFDPYYDYCVGYGYRYRWEHHPRATALYRERYVRIRESHPDYGRYRYAPRYRSSTRYREGREYDWSKDERKRGSAGEREPDWRKRERERRPETPGKGKGGEDKSGGKKRSKERGASFLRGGT